MEYNPLDPEVRQNPYPSYAHLRNELPVHRIEPMGAFAISRYDDVMHVLTHPEIFSSAGISNTHLHDRETGEVRPTRMMVFSDPPDHTRLRNIVNRSFTPRMIADLEPRIQQITDDLIAAVTPKGAMDLITDLAMPLPVTIIAEILGVDPAHKEAFKRWSDDAVRDDSHSTSAAQHGPDDHDGDGGSEFQAYFEQAVAERRRQPRNDMISDLIRAEEEQQALSSDEVLAFIALLLIAGNETTTNLLGNAMIALLDNPDQLAKVRDDPSLIPNLVEEALRYDAPVQFLFRFVTRDTELAGTSIPEGSIVLPIYGSANRDERKYPEGDRFDVTRDTQGHIAFGHGIHFCLGAPLARLEGRIALEALLSRLDRFTRVDDQIEQIDSIFLRGPKRLRLTFEQAKDGAKA
ncbi:MAG: cytochrome P450 [Dehalococcoidia bacterium]